MANQTPESLFSQDVNCILPLPQADFESTKPRSFEVSGDLKKTYFAKSPYSEIEAYAVGFIIWNKVVGVSHSVKTWEQAKALQNQISCRYKTINSYRG